LPVAMSPRMPAIQPIRGAKRAAHRGAITLELILVLIVLVVVLVAVFEFAMVMLVQGTVTHSATVAAREAGKGEDLAEIVRVVQAIVRVNCITISDAPGSGTKVVLENGTAPTEVFGDPELDCPTPPNVLAPDEVRVTVCVAFEATPICDALHAYGFSFAGSQFWASSLVKKE